jgi:hypothetical protein
MKCIQTHIQVLDYVGNEISEARKYVKELEHKFYFIVYNIAFVNSER